MTEPSPSPIDQIAERVERLLVRHEEVLRTNALLIGELEGVTRERDSLKSRLGAARSRIDALLDRLQGASSEAGSAPGASVRRDGGESAA